MALRAANRDEATALSGRRLRPSPSLGWLEIDHVLRAVADLAAAAREMEEHHGLASIAGGRHPGWGTANRIVPLGETYLELVAVVDEVEARQSVFGRWVASGANISGRPIGWAVRAHDIEDVRRRLGLTVRAGSRVTANGDRLEWRAAGMEEAAAEGYLPFFIERGAGTAFPGHALVKRRPAGLLARRARTPNCRDSRQPDARRGCPIPGRSFRPRRAGDPIDILVKTSNSRGQRPRDYGARGAPGNPVKGVGKMERSLYERLGGMESIVGVVEDFRDRVAEDARINQKFARTDLGRLRKMLIDQVCEVAGGPCTYTGRNMKDAHAGMKVTNGEFDALVEDLVATLNHFKVGKTEQAEILGVLGPLKSDIVEVDSSQVGTPLPATYQPAPALMR